MKLFLQHQQPTLLYHTMHIVYTCKLWCRCHWTFVYIDLGMLLYFILSDDDFEIKSKYYSFIVVSSCFDSYLAFSGWHYSSEYVAFYTELSQPYFTVSVCERSYTYNVQYVYIHCKYTYIQCKYIHCMYVCTYNYSVHTYSVSIHTVYSMYTLTVYTCIP